MDFHFPSGIFLSRKLYCCICQERMQLMLRKLLFIVVFAPALAACAIFPSAAQSVSPKQTAAIEATCDKVMRLPPGAEFGACVSSLSDSAAALASAEFANKAYDACEQVGLKRETPEFSRCVLDRENAQKGSGNPSDVASKLDTAFITPVDSNQDSYFASTPNVRHRREQYACAQLGLEPDTGAFTSCVGNLDMEIFVVEHPNG
jgi:hypothetical protein